MEALKYLKLLYSGENATKRHITLFSIIGLIVLMWNNVISAFGNNLIYPFITTVEITNVELFLELFFGVCLLFLLFGYEYVFIHKVMNENTTELPELESDSYSVFFKMLPIFILWQFYYTVVSVVGGGVLAVIKNSVASYIFSSVMLCLTPFVFMVFINYAYDFKVRKEIFFPWTIIKYLNKSMMDVIKFFIEFCIVAALPVFALIGFFDWFFSIQDPTQKLCATLICLCVASYVFVIFKYVFSLGLAKIVKEKFINSSGKEFDNFNQE